ncbi:MAG: GIY-YIG nuclease family protein [Cyanobacteria bacterium J06636_27]
MTKGIYQIKCNVNNRQYIGLAKDIEKRWKQHEKALNSQTHENSKLQADWNHFGADKFEFSIIQRWKRGQKLEDLEDIWISQLEPYYNIRLGKRCKK